MHQMNYGTYIYIYNMKMIKFQKKMTLEHFFLLKFIKFVKVILWLIYALVKLNWIYKFITLLLNL